MATIAEALEIALQHHRAGRLDLAQQVYQEILRADPNQADAIHLLGLLAHQVGQDARAVEYIRRAIELNGNEAIFHNNLGEAYRALWRLPEAIACYRRAVELKPDYVDVHNNLGVALSDLGKADEAMACYRTALELDPHFPAAHVNLGAALQEQGRLDEAEVCYRQAVALEPGFAEAHNNLGTVLQDQGRLEEAADCYRRAVELRPDFVEADSNLVYAINFSPAYDATRIFAEHQRWNRQHAEALAASIQPFTNDRSPGRRLRIGYVSPDFRNHPVGRFLLPLLEAHDRAEFEVFCYASVRMPDAVIERCRAQADTWRDVRGLTDEEVAQRVRADRVDILVDLTMHMCDNRLLIFARKPAPIQVTYLAYCGTTGLGTIDYRLTDPYLDPPGIETKVYSEQSFCLPETYWCYRPLVTAPEPSPLPGSTMGYITFGCLNNFGKVSAPAISAWSELLRALPTARMILHAQPGGPREAARNAFARQGVSPDRLTFAGYAPAEQYFQIYRQIDIALDPFPYGGGTTTCDALWMGVPVVSLAGQTAVGRAGLSILSNVGLPDLVARDLGEYVKIAAKLAGDLPRLAQLRAALRGRLKSSPLMDEPRFARNVEAAYRAMWQRWCRAETG